MKRVTVKVNVPKPVVAPPTTYSITLTLTKREAEALQCLCRNVGGPRETTARGVTDDLNEALYEAGLDRQVSATAPGSLYFLPYEAYENKKAR